MGPTGPQGAVGPQGPIGPTGPQGDVGPRGRRADGNLFPDPYFEEGLTHWDRLGTQGVLVDSITPIAGGQVYTNAPGGYAWISAQPIPVNTQNTYALSAHIRLSSPGTLGGLYLVIRLLDDEGDEITGDGTYWYYPLAHHIPANSDWVKVSASFGSGTSRPIPANARRMAIAAILNSTPTGGAGDRRFEVTGLTVDTPSSSFGGRTIGRVTQCTYNSSNTNPPTWPGVPTHFYWHWRASDCDNGLPSGQCLGFMYKASHCGGDQDWIVALPGEIAGGVAAMNGGMDWWTSSPCAGFGIGAVYMCRE